MAPLKEALYKIIDVLEAEKIDYMIVGGFAASYHNRTRTTNDIDLVVQIYSNSVKRIVQHFPEWEGQTEVFTELFEEIGMFNITDFTTGIRFDIMAYRDSDYNWIAFQRRTEQEFLGRQVFFCSIEDLIIGKLGWYDTSQSEKQLSDLMYLKQTPNINWDYINNWVNRLNLDKYGVLGKDGKRNGGSGGGTGENLLFFPRG
ncbi:MAG: DUF6036 family nucleotidyltransferase, partial [Bacteroidota bacterium]